MHLAQRGGGVLGGPLQGAGGLQIVGQRRECRCVLGWEAVRQILICNSRLFSPRPRDSGLRGGVSEWKEVAECRHFKSRGPSH